MDGWMDAYTYAYAQIEVRKSESVSERGRERERERKVLSRARGNAMQCRAGAFSFLRLNDCTYTDESGKQQFSDSEQE